MPSVQHAVVFSPVRSTTQTRYCPSVVCWWTTNAAGAKTTAVIPLMPPQEVVQRSASATIARIPSAPTVWRRVPAATGHHALIVMYLQLATFATFFLVNRVMTIMDISTSVSAAEQTLVKIAQSCASVTAAGILSVLSVPVGIIFFANTAAHFTAKIV